MTVPPPDRARPPAALAVDTFRSLHQRRAHGVWSAPGRVNLIGEHTDYNDGYVLPFALPHRIAAAVAPRQDRILTLATLGSDGRLQQTGPLDMSRLRPGSPSGWAAYPAGVAWVLQEQGLACGADLVLAGNIPNGAGLSSSAALECAVALALLDIAGHDEPDAARRAEIARWAQRAENEFVGVPTGVLDQTASMCCTADHVLFLDVRSGTGEYVPFDPAGAGLGILVIDTRVKHSHADSGYTDRRHGTERAAALLGVDSLRDIPADRLPEALRRLPAGLRPLVRHVVTENARVLEVVNHLRAGSLQRIGPALDASHRSLRDDYRVSCTELDLAVSTAREAGALGARMTGGGFGGSAIALVHRADRHTVEQTITTAFERAGLRTPSMFLAVPSPGAGRD